MRHKGRAYMKNSHKHDHTKKSLLVVFKTILSHSLYLICVICPKIIGELWHSDQYAKDENKLCHHKYKIVFTLQFYSRMRRLKRGGIEMEKVLVKSSPTKVFFKRPFEEPKGTQKHASKTNGHNSNVWLGDYWEPWRVEGGHKGFQFFWKFLEVCQTCIKISRYN